jgi:hypothetical protein
MTFFQFYYFALNYLPLRIIIFLLLLLFCYFGLVNLTQVKLQVKLHFFYFFILLRSFFLVFSWKFFFLSWSHVASGGLVKLTQVGSNCFPRFSYEFFFSFFSFCIKLFVLEFCYFFTFLSIWLFQERVNKVNPV